jgi:hypothetical protein
MAWFGNRSQPSEGNGGNNPVNRQCDCEVLQVKGDWSTICQCRDSFTSSKASDKICSRCIMGKHSWNR